MISAIAYFPLTQLLMFEAVSFVYKALLAIALDDGKKAIGCFGLTQLLMLEETDG